MLGERELRRILFGGPLIPLQGPFHRYTELYYLVEALRERRRPGILAGVGAFLLGGRYNPPRSFETLYVATTGHTALLEAKSTFLASRIVADLPPETPLLYVGINGRLSNVLDLTNPDVLTALGTTTEKLEAPWMPFQARGVEAPTQTLGRIAYETGRIEALYYHSTKDKPSGRCVAIFPRRLAPPSSIEIVDHKGLIGERLP